MFLFKIGLFRLISKLSLISSMNLLQYSLQLADTVGAKKNCPLIGGVRLLESFSISVLVSRIKHFPVSARCSWVD